MKDLVIGGRKFANRFFLGTGKFASREIMEKALAGLAPIARCILSVRESCISPS